MSVVCVSVVDFLPEVEHILTVREKQMKKRLLMDLPRRTSDRIAIKSAIKEEDVRVCVCTCGLRVLSLLMAATLLCAGCVT